MEENLSVENTNFNESAEIVAPVEIAAAVESSVVAKPKRKRAAKKASVKVAKKAAKKATKKVAAKSGKGKRGRPPVYTAEQIKHFTALVLKYGLTNAMKKLNARKGSKEAAGRNEALITPACRKISRPTLSKHVKPGSLRLGRPPFKKAA